MVRKPDVEEARRLAETLHAGQTDRLGLPYAAHVADVARRVAGLGPAVETVAWLHDALEDTDLTPEEIGARFGPDIRAGVDAMTRRAGEDYAGAYLARVAACPQAVPVKIADAAHNLGKAHLLAARDPDRAARLARRYRDALRALGADPEKVPRIGFRDGAWQELQERAGPQG